ncbi:MAG: hypothetical protein PHN75_09205 [Syntrophales bacterium]|nr:hypothetical protein [Syntrophales bacterium]
MKGNESGVEIIAVKIDGQVCRTYKGLSGTFAGFADCCLRKKVLPGSYQKDLVTTAVLRDRNLFLSLSGNRTQEELLEILDDALLNIVAFPETGSEAECFIEVGLDH